MTRAVTVLGVLALSLLLSLLSLALARREYAKEVIFNTKATIAWKESDAVSGAVITSIVLNDLSSGNKASAVKALCRSLALDVKNIEGLSEISQIDPRRRISALKRSKQTLVDVCGPM
jgi:hypothetical protein